MSKILSCPRCEFETTESLAKCPNCGRRLQSKQKVRVLGWVLVLLGGVLVVSMGGLGIFLASIIMDPGQPGRPSRFTGGPEEIMFIVGVFGLVISFGLAAMAGGAWQIWYGKPNRVLMVVMFLLAGLFWAIGIGVKYLT